MKSRPRGRSLADFGELKEAEQKLLQSCRRGDACVIADDRPIADGKTESNTVRAAFLRFLILGGDDENPVHEYGVSIKGAWIAGVLDLRGVASTSSVRAHSCWIDRRPLLHDAHIKGVLILSDSRIPGLKGDRLTCDASLFCRGKFLSNGEVRLLGAVIGGNFECDGATFNRHLKSGKQSGNALHADRITVKGGVFLRNGFTAHGTVRLLGAVIGGDLSCHGGRFNTTTKYSINAIGMSVEGRFIFNGLKAPAREVNLAHARVRVLVDDEAAWGEGLRLDGFIYERISGPSPKDAETRRKWLDKQWPKWSGRDGKTDQFLPQPWLQLRKVLRETGHAEDARLVGIKFEERRRKCGQIKPEAWIFHWAYGYFTGYGYRPMWLLGWSLLVWLICGLVYDVAAYNNVFAPSDSLVNYAMGCSDLVKCTKPELSVFQPPFNGSYPVFHPFAYSLNVFLPVVNLGQEAAWAPAEKPFSPDYPATLSTDFAGIVQLLIWVETLLGWIAGLLLVAVVSGLARKQDDS